MLKSHFPFNNYWIYLTIVLSIVANACIEPYEADINGDVELISIEGSIIKGNPAQHVSISTTTSLLEKEFKPIRGCEVKVVDDLNNEFLFEENTIGKYESVIADNNLVYNK